MFYNSFVNTSTEHYGVLEMQLFTVLQRGLNFPPQEMFAYTRFQQEFQLFLCFLCGIVCLVKDTSAEGHNLQTEEEYIYIYIYCYIYIYILFYIYICMYRVAQKECMFFK